MKVFDQLSEMKTPEEIENIMTEILPMFYSSVKLKYLLEKYVCEITEYPKETFEVSRQIFQFDGTIKHWQDFRHNVLNFFRRSFDRKCKWCG
jgi:hypothetical protein